MSVPTSTAANAAPAYFSLRLTMFKVCAGRCVTGDPVLILRTIVPPALPSLGHLNNRLERRRSWGDDIPELPGKWLRMRMTSLNPFELTGRAATHMCASALALDARLHAERRSTPAQALREASAAAGIDLAIVSSLPDFARQSAIWNGKFRGERPLLDRGRRSTLKPRLSAPERVRAILIWSALPGASRHHWGTDFDVIDRAAVPPGYQAAVNSGRNSPGRGPFARLNEWLGANLGNFGFFRPYTTDRGGVRPEPWHLSYAPVAVPALAGADAGSTEGGDRAGASSKGREHVLAQLPELYDRVRRVGRRAVTVQPCEYRVSGCSRPS